ncbi:MAG: hypothetical protein PHP17_06175 [Candidatus Omnitrophica bacterium]|nr:hypothetical protein [Candidatus Omnitrophota bacterium]
MQNILKKREKIILGITMGIILFSIIFNFIIAPVLARYDAVSREISLNRVRLKKYLTLLTQKNEIQGKYEKFLQAPTLTSDAKDALVVVMSSLENIAKADGVKIVDVRPQSQAKEGVVIIELRTQGEMDAYTKFIYDVETSLLLLKINRLQFTAKPNTTGLEAMFTITEPVVSK